MLLILIFCLVLHTLYFADPSNIGRPGDREQGVKIPGLQGKLCQNREFQIFTSLRYWSDDTYERSSNPVLSKFYCHVIRVGNQIHDIIIFNS